MGFVAQKTMQKTANAIILSSPVFQYGEGKRNKAAIISNVNITHTNLKKTALFLIPIVL